MTQAEKRAMEAYPEPKRSDYSDTQVDYKCYLLKDVQQAFARNIYQEGYQQALDDNMDELDFAKQLERLRESQRNANLDEFINTRWEDGNITREAFERAVKAAFEIGMEQNK